MVLVSFAVYHAVVLGVLTATAWATGRLGLRVLRLGKDVVPQSLAVTIGLALLAQGGLLLGMLGGLRLAVLALAVVGIHIAAIRDWRRVATTLLRIDGRERWRLLMLSVVIVALATPFFLLALYPPLGFDQTLYHLPYARAFAATGGVPFLPALRYPVFPQLAEVLDAAVLLWAGEVATQLVGWLALIVCLGLVMAWARDLSSAAGGWLAAATLAGSPIAIYLASTGYVEPMLALFGVAALYAAMRASQESSVAWIVLSGGFVGTAASVKYLGLFFIPAAAFLLLPRHLTCASSKEALRRLGLYGVAVLVALAPSYGRLIAYTGNPLFPFYPELFGASPWTAQEFLGKRGMARLMAASTSLWDMVFRRQAVGALPPFSPIFAVSVPIVVAGAWRQPALRGLLVLALGYVLIAPVQAHYFLGIAPLWSVLIGASAAALVERRDAGRRFLWVLAVALAFGGEGYAVYRIHRLGMPPATSAERERLLTAELPLYPAVAFLNHTSGQAIVYGIGAENMTGYVSGTLLGDFNGPTSYARTETHVRLLGSLSAALDEIGAVYFLVPNRPSDWTRWAIADPRLERVYDDAHATVYRVRPVM
jgi:hypothetical protein